MFGIKSRRRINQENAAMRQALLWYAAKETWRRKGIHQKGAPRKKWRKSPAAFDRGSLASRTLSFLDEPRFSAWGALLSMPVTVPAPCSDPPMHWDSPERHINSTDTE